MRFTQIPNHFSTVRGELPYSFTNAPSSETVMYLIDARTGQTIGSKRLYNTPTGTIDIAPLLRKRLRFSTPAAREGFAKANNRTLSVYVSIDGVASDPRTFTDTDHHITDYRFISSLPRRRVISYGEFDELFFLTPSSFSIHVQSNALSNNVRTYNYVPGSSLFMVFRADTLLFHPSTTSMTVQMAVDGQVIDQIDYTIVPAIQGGCRVAWRSHAGALEHYTFPVVKHVEQAVEAARIYSPDTGYTPTGIQTEQITTLRSAYEPTEVIQALAGIAASPQVWIHHGDLKYEEVDVIPTGQILQRHGSLCCAEISLRPKLKTRLL